MIHKSKAESVQMQYTVAAMKKMSERSGVALSLNADGKMDHIAVRTTMEAGYANYPIAPGVTFESFDICSVPMEVSVPNDIVDKNNILLYIHGGGFCCGSAKLSRGISSQLAVDLGCKVYSVDYRLCPENVFPAGVDDCYTAYKALVKEYPNANIAIIGESAGATFTLTTTLRALRNGIKKPACIVLNSPLVSLEALNRNREGQSDCTISPDIFPALKNFYYTSGTNLKDPDISPIYGVFSGCPPTVISVAENETLATDAYMLHDKLEHMGVDVTLLSVDGAFHAFGATGKGTPESASVLEYAEQKIKQSFNN